MIIDVDMSHVIMIVNADISHVIMIVNVDMSHVIIIVDVDISYVIMIVDVDMSHVIMIVDVDMNRLIMDDAHSQVIKYKLRFSFIALIVLHEDPSSNPGDQLDPGQSSTEKLQTMAERFFSRCKGISPSGVVDLAQLRTQYSEVCRNNHLR